MFGDIINVLRYGGEVANAEAWKKGAINVSALGAFLSSLFGIAYHYGWVTVSLDSDTATRLAGALVTLFSVVFGLFTAATSKRAGILPAKGTESEFPKVVVQDDGQADNR